MIWLQAEHMKLLRAKERDNMKTKLKPCPFCGSKAEIISEEGVYRIINKCPTECILSDIIRELFFWKKASAILFWNRRELKPK